jgi:hypothetical protein
LFCKLRICFCSASCLYIEHHEMDWSAANRFDVSMANELVGHKCGR